MHNIHGYYLNLKVLFKYLKNEYKGKIVWTLHDCWAFTGHCSYFTSIKCNKWQKKCFNCPRLNVYPKEYFDTTKKEFELKKKLFTNLNNLTLVTPSNWLKDLVKISFLKKYKVEVINNGIDLNIFKPTYDETIYDKYNIPRNKKIILGVANVWTKEKGLYDFIKLSEKLDDSFVIVLVGVDDKIQKILPNNILAIKRTDNQIDLAKIYTIADVFVNPTYEDNYPTTNLESIACGTFTVCYNTGGCKEQISAKGIVEVGNLQALLDKIQSFPNEKFDNVKDCKIQYALYLKLYK